jgi:hypothetical protein
VKTRAIFFMAALAAATVSQACVRAGVNAKKHFHARYAVAGAFACRTVRVDDTTLTYTYYTAPESLRSHWMVQMPCYRDSDLKTVTAGLSRSELEELARVINKSGFLRLPDRCGGPEGEGMSAPMILEAGSDKVEKRVFYIRDRKPVPEAIVAFRAKLAEMVQAKFGLTF